MSNKRYPDANGEPTVIDTDPTGNTPRGHYRDQGVSMQERIKAAAREDEGIWVDRKDQAKQGMTRNPPRHDAQAAPDHPHTGPAPGSGPQ